MTRYTRRELEIADHLWECLVRIAEDNGTEPQAVLNQAIFDLARRFNFLTPSSKKATSQPNAPPSPAAPKQRPAPASVPPKAATSAAPRAALCVVNGAGEMLRVEKDPFIIGRSRTCDLVIPSSKVSRQHCRVLKENNDYFLEDLGSPNGVWRDGVKITKEKIKDGDEFMLSDEVVKFVFKTAARK